VQSAVSGQVEEILKAMHFSDGQIVSYAECIEVRETCGSLNTALKCDTFEVSGIFTAMS
jgi:hypothetical protein